MSDYIVSARKYRPDSFDTVVGQESITATLKNAIRTKHLAQAYLFCGPRGVGKTTCARIFAKTINCNDLTGNFEACNTCESCLSFNQNRSFNIHELDAASNNSVEDIRLLIDKVRIPPQVSRYSVYIIDEVHMLSQSAFNAFLKTLEEPPKHAIFILATTEKHKILPTILSRCQIFDFNRIKIKHITDYLAQIASKEKIEYEEDALNIIAHKADGAMRDALSIFDQIVSFSDGNISYHKVIENLNILDYDYYFKLTDHFLHKEVSKALLLYDDILAHGFDAHNFINNLCRHFRDLLVCKSEETLQLLEVGDSLKQQYLEQSKKCSNETLFSFLEICSACDISFKSSRNQRLHVELTLVKLCNQGQKKNDEIVTEEKLYLPSSEKKPEPQKRSTEDLDSAQVKESPETITENITEFTSTVKPTTPSIKDALSSLKKNTSESEASVEKENENTEDNDEQDIVAENEEDSGFPSEDLQSVWEKFTGNLKSEEPRMYNVLHSQKPSLTEGYLIELNFFNNAQVDEFKFKIKPSLLSLLRNDLKNTRLEIKETIQGEEYQSNTKYYTDADKLKYMAEKNPALQKLRQEFNLDFE